MFGAMMAEIRPSALPCQASANSTACRSCAWRSAGSYRYRSWRRPSTSVSRVITPMRLRIPSRSTKGA